MIIIIIAYDHYPHHYPRCKTMWRTVVSTSGFFSSSLKGAVNIVHSCSGNITNPLARITKFEEKLKNVIQTRGLRGVRAIPHRGSAGGDGGEEGRREQTWRSLQWNFLHQFIWDRWCATYWMKHILPHFIRDLQPTGLKKWSSSQTREFGDLHALIATLILACDTRWWSSWSSWSWWLWRWWWWGYS